MEVVRLQIAKPAGVKGEVTDGSVGNRYCRDIGFVAGHCADIAANLLRDDSLALNELEAFDMNLFVAP